MRKLEGKVALITGSGRGIGRALALKLAADGASLVISDLDEAPAEATAKEIRDGGGKAVTCVGNVAAPDFGASERMVVSPGHEADGILHMPGGQSGNPLSPFWGAGHEDWVQGKPTPFLPGKTAYTLTLEPKR